MKIEILGTGCCSCDELMDTTKEAIAGIDGFHSVEKVEDLQKIMEYGVMNTPALVVDGVVKSSGKKLKLDEVIELIK